MSPKIFLLFDVDGTLVHSNKVDSECFATVYENIYGLPFPSIDWRNYPHVTDHTIFGTVIEQHFKRVAEAEEMEIFQEQFVNLLEQKRRVSPEKFMEVPGARETMDRLLADERFELGIATGGWERPARLKLRHVGIPVERMIVSAADNQVTREDILQRAIDVATAKQEQLQRTVYIGDAIWDVHTTRNMGLDFVGLRLQGDFASLTSVGAQTVIQDYKNYEVFLDAVAQANPPHAQI